MPIEPYFQMTALQAARFRDETRADSNRLDPRLVEAGPYKNFYVLPERVIYADEFAAHRDAFRMLTVIQMDTDVAFPIPPEELARRAAEDV